MKQPDSNSPGEPPDIDPVIQEAAARWIIRRDAGLSARESIEFELWLADDERHAAAIKRASTAWSLLDRLPDEAAQFVAERPVREAHRVWLVLGGLAAALAVAAHLLFWRAAPGTGAMNDPPGSAVRLATDAGSARVQTLPDGTTVRLNAGSEIAAQYVPGERHVSVVRGEVHFTVTKDPSRPFVVRAGAIEVRALGTAFNVNLQSATVEVLVTEGSVQLGTSPGSPAVRLAPVQPAAVGGGAVSAASNADARPVVEMGQRALISLEAASAEAKVVVSEVKPDEIAKVLAWQSPLLRLGGATLAELALEFGRQTGQRIVFTDPELPQRRIGGRFRADDVDGFVRLLEENYDLTSQRTPDGAIVLRKKP